MSAAAASRSPAAFGELGCQLAPRTGQTRVRPVHRDERPPGQLGPLRWQQLGEHGLTGEGVAEPEPLAVHGDELGVDGSTQRPDHGRAVDRGDTGKQVPVEPPAQHGRGGEHMPGVGVECLKPGAQRRREAGGYRGGGCLLGPPPPVRPASALPR